MSNPITRENKEDAIFHPEDYFDRPKDVILEEKLSLDEKERALLAWKMDMQLEEVAEEENMTGGKTRDILDKIDNALRIVRSQLPKYEDHSGPNKSGEM